MNKGTHKKSYIVSFIHVFFLLFIALILPQFFFTHDSKYTIAGKTVSDSPVSCFKLGIENISAEFLLSLRTGKQVIRSAGLITNHTGMDQAGKRSIDVLLAKGVPLTTVYVPEEDMMAYQKTQQSSDEVCLIGLPRINSLKKTKEYAFNEVDLLFFDLQDTSMSPHTSLVTLAKTLESAVTQKKTVVVLDRPNLLGSSMEGIPGSDLLAIPLRHGMTIGEIARYFNTTILGNAARLYVVPMHNYDRTISMDSGSSLLTNIDTYYGTNFLTMLNGVAPFDIGLGTDLAFACLALPDSLHVSKQKWFELRTLLKKQGIEASWCRYMNAKKRASYAGLRLMVKDIDQFSPFNTMVTVLNFFKNAGVKLSFSADFDRNFGGKKIREFLEGKISGHDFEHMVNKGLKNFFNKAQNSFIYKPVPRIVLL